MEPLLKGPIPAERAATCDRCAMLPSGDAPVDRSEFFSASTKCCTYLPELANFLVGRVLTDDDLEAAAGRATVEARIDKKVGVSPLGLHRTPVYSLMYRSSPASFGRAVSMRCPHYVVDGGRCGVWRHRESTCATWFCKYGRGETGRAFWQRLHDTLGACEGAVRLHCLMELGLDVRTLAALHPTQAVANASARPGNLGAPDLDGEFVPAAYRAAWGAWEGREREFFSSCAEIANALDWPEVLALGGARLEVLVALLLDAYKKLVGDEVPARVRRRRLNVVYASPESVQVVGYSPMDALRVPKELVDVLHCFDGRPTAAALAGISEVHGLDVEPGVVRKLVDFGILSAEED